MLERLYPHLVSGVLAFVLFLLVAYPIFVHVAFGWRRKADDIICAISDKAAQLYLANFQKIDVSQQQAKQAFNDFYYKWYGRRFLFTPVAILLSVTFISVFMLGETAEVALKQFNKIEYTESDYLNLPLIATASVVGAFAFVAWDIISRVARKILGQSDILGASIRLVIAVPLGYAFSSIVKNDVGPLVAFAAGAFPLQSVQEILQHLANKQIGLEEKAASATDSVVRLAGVDQTIAERLGEADISTIAQLAYCDPIQISMQTYLRFAYISDISAQALAWIYLGERLDKLRPIGLRGAVEFRTFFDELEAKDAAALAFLPKAAQAANLCEEEFRNVAHEIGHDPYTEFLAETW